MDRPPSLPNPTSQEWLTTRKGETIGGGHWVFRRDAETGRIVPMADAFEYSDYNHALTEAALLQSIEGGAFVVVSMWASVGGRISQMEVAA